LPDLNCATCGALFLIISSTICSLQANESNAKLCANWVMGELSALLNKNQLSRQTGSRNLMGLKTLPTIWYTYMMLVTKYQISAINSSIGFRNPPKLLLTKRTFDVFILISVKWNRISVQNFAIHFYTPAPRRGRGVYCLCYDFSRKSLSKYLMDTIDFNKHDIDIFINLAKIVRYGKHWDESCNDYY
jgi:hypothetical protein